MSENAIAIPTYGSVLRVDFDASAIEYGFDGLSAGVVNVNSGNLSVSNGSVFASFDRGDNVVPTYFDGGDSSIIRLDFSGLISAIGMDFNSNSADTTLYSRLSFSENAFFLFGINGKTFLNQKIK
ncbi:MAG: hypothetical protein V3U75_07655 [Methylococcaceae bacterium]